MHNKAWIRCYFLHATLNVLGVVLVGGHDGRDGDNPWFLASDAICGSSLPANERLNKYLACLIGAA